MVVRDLEALAAYYEDLPEAERAALAPTVEPLLLQLVAIREKLSADPIRPFLDTLTPHQVLPPHVQPILDAFSDARIERQFVVVSMPARMAKTEAITRSLAWWLKRYPSDLSGYTSYSDNQAHEKSAMARRYAAMAGCNLLPGSRRLWQTEEGGGLKAAGAGGGLIGTGLQGWLIVDDPYPNGEAAESPAFNSKLRAWFEQVAFSRSEGANVLVQHHRWDTHDLIGWLLKEQRAKWRKISLPALAEKNDILGRAPGEALWPSNPLWTKEEMEKIHAFVSEWVWATMYQQNPQPKGAKLFHETVVTFTMAEHRREPRGSWRRVVIGADPAASKNQRSDHSAAIVMAFQGSAEKLRARILDVLRCQVTIPDFSRRLFALSQKWNAPVYVEAVGGFRAVPDLLKEWVPKMPVHEAPVRGDKFLRAQGASAGWNTGRIEVLEDAPWLDEFLPELYAFTGVEGGQDDQVDALAHGWNAVASTPDYGGMLHELVTAM